MFTYLKLNPPHPLAHKFWGMYCIITYFHTLQRFLEILGYFRMIEVFLILFLRLGQ